MLVAAIATPPFDAAAQQEAQDRPMLVGMVTADWSWEPRSMPSPPLVTPPEQLRSVLPEFPSSGTVRQGYQGTVVLEGTIDAAGRVRDLRVVRSPAEVFDQRSLDAVADWAFQPAVRDGLPVAVTGVFTLRFAINAAQEAAVPPQQRAREGEPTGLRATAMRMGAPGLVAPRLLQTELPEYTENARAAGIEGDVYVEAVITTQGTIADPVLVRGLPDEELNRRALAALSQWVFAPGTQDEQPVAVLALLTITFRVD